MSQHVDRWEATMVPNYGTPDLELAEGDGAHVTDAEGNTYLDLLAGLAVNAVGHGHPAVVEAVTEQVGTLAHVSNLYATDSALTLAERLSERTYGHRAALVNSGSEANEVAYKIARRNAHANNQPEARVLAFENSFHGRTTGALALTGQPAKREGFGPFPDPVEFVPYDDPAALEAAFEEGPVAAVFTEYVQGEGGILPIPDETAETLHRLVDEHDALLVADEVQTGVGRTGRFFAHQHHDIEPDIVTMAKAIGGGLPVGACLARPELAEHMGPGSHGCTFGGNPVTCAAANAVLDVYEEQALGARAAALGQRLGKALDAVALDHRGRGLLVGVEVPDRDADEAMVAAREAGLLVGTAGNEVLRLAPPLTIGEDDLLGAVPAIANAVEVANERS